MTTPNKVSKTRAWLALVTLYGAWVCVLWAMTPQSAPVQFALTLLVGAHMYTAFRGLLTELLPKDSLEPPERHPSGASVPVEELYPEVFETSRPSTPPLE
jgi:hypothetical protein